VEIKKKKRREGENKKRNDAKLGRTMPHVPSKKVGPTVMKL
jgi:hypothetical protein